MKTLKAGEPELTSSEDVMAAINAIHSRAGVH
jgi:hypothetical protein